jgi:hypothetical protein
LATHTLRRCKESADQVFLLCDFLVAFTALLISDIVLLSGKFSAIRSVVNRIPIKAVLPRTRPLEQTVATFTSASVAYFRTVKCIHRSAALTCLLRLHGIRANFVVGCRSVPFFSHAWVEVNGNAIDQDRELIAPLAIIDRF